MEEPSENAFLYEHLALLFVFYNRLVERYPNRNPAHPTYLSRKEPTTNRPYVYPIFHLQEPQFHDDRGDLWLFSFPAPVAVNQLSQSLSLKWVSDNLSAGCQPPAAQ